MKLKLLNASCLSMVLFLFIIATASCKKDKLVVNEVKEYFQDVPVINNMEGGGWRLILKPDGTANVIPSGDIIFGGTYKINGSKIKVKTDQNSGSYTFEIISATKIKEKEFGTFLKLK